MKSKKTIISIIIVLALATYATYLFVNDGAISNKTPNSEFAFKETSAIDKIVIRDITNDVATLTKEQDTWMINGKFKAKPESINLILETIKNIKVQSKVPAIAEKSVITDLAAQSKKVDFYENGNLSKTYYIGNATQDNTGTYMLLETPNKGRSSIPYIIHLPGFNGFLNTRFFGNEGLWKYTGVFTYELANIKSVTIQDVENKKESFSIKQSNGNISFLDSDGKSIQSFNSTLVKNYLLNYKNIHYNRIEQFNQAQIDSLKGLTPHFSVEVIDSDEKTTKLSIYKMPSNKKGIDPVTGKPYKWDINHALGIINNENEVKRFQYFTLDKIIMPKSFFLQ